MSRHLEHVGLRLAQRNGMASGDARWVAEFLGKWSNEQVHPVGFYALQGGGYFVFGNHDRTSDGVQTFINGPLPAKPVGTVTIHGPRSVTVCITAERWTPLGVACHGPMGRPR